MTPRRQRILVVDDNEAGRYATGRVLRQAGFETAEAGTGGDALKRAAQDRPRFPPRWCCRCRHPP